MRSRPLLLLPALWLATAAASPPASPPTARPTPAPTPAPTATPSHGSINLLPAAGPAGSRITVTGSGFFANEAISLYIDNQDTPLGTATADAHGAFSWEAVVPDGLPQAAHDVCVAQQPSARCAQFRVLAANQPSPTATPLPVATPDLSPAPVPATAPATAPASAISILFQPPFVLLPILLLLALLGAAVLLIRRGRGGAPPLPPAAIVSHRSPRVTGGGPRPSGAPPIPTGAPPGAPEAPAPPPQSRTRAAGSEDQPDLPEPSD